MRKTIKKTIKALYTSPLTDLFIPTPTLLLWEALSHAVITAWEDHSFTFPTWDGYSQVLIYIIQLNELGRRGENENA